MASKLLDKIISDLSADALRYFFPGLVRKDEKNDDAARTGGTPLPPAPGDDILFSKKSTPKKPESLQEPESWDSGTRFSITFDESSPASFDLNDILFEERVKRPLPKPRQSPSRPAMPGLPVPPSACQAEAVKKKTRKKSDRSLADISASALRRILPEPGPADLEPDARTQALLDEIDAIQKKYGITIEELEAALSYRVRLSHLRITRHHAIILDDFDRQEVKMDTLTKAVFLLYLKHPEGIRYKDLSDHRRELEDIYMSISGRSDLEGIRKSIADLTDSIMSNSINEKVSKAKKAFRDVIEDRVAKFYYIDGKQGAAKSIALDRSLVIWE